LTVVDVNACLPCTQKIFDMSVISFFPNLQLPHKTKGGEDKKAANSPTNKIKWSYNVK